MKTVISGWLDISTRNPDLFGEAILLRDSDGMGFALDLDQLRGKFVRITIEEQEDSEVPLWFTGRH